MNLTNSQYNSILREYDNKRLEDKHILDMRTKEIYAKIPAVKEIDNEIITNSIAHAKQAIFGDNDAVKELEASNLDLSMQKAELLIANGYPGDYLSPVYQCKDCKDSGFIGNEKCHCFKKAIAELVYSQSTIQSVVQLENFRAFRYDYYSKELPQDGTGPSPYENIVKVVKTCENFIRHFNTSYENLVIYGNAGVGKTFLCNCIAKELLDTSHSVIYLTSYQLFDILAKSKFNKNTDNTNMKDYDSYSDYLMECELLIIDDLGTEMNNSFVSSQLYNLINERHLKQLSTIISTNFTLDELYQTYSERIFSRLTGNYTFLNIFGDDIRYKKHFL
ncbi:DNA replication protein DnaC [Lachnospiraceae bacterium KM106-2]|nr:DNA replication protein DnaC [Lachnospiraceae bacterium KM106-2]